MSTKKSTPTETDAVMSICRLCALVSSSQSFVPLFIENEEEQVTTKQINQLVPNLISFNDGLPQDACLKCVDSVSKCFKFISHVLETQDKLRRMIQISEAEKLNHANSSPNQFLENDQSSSATDVDFDLLTRNDNISRLNRNVKIVSRNKNTTEALSKRVKDPNDSPSSVETINATDAYSKRLSAYQFKSLSKDVRAVSDSPPARVFRCGICFEKFTDKEACLKHIVDNHSGIRKPVQPDTIFETVRKAADGGSSRTSSGATSSSRVIGKSGSNASVAQQMAAKRTNGVVPISSCSSSHNDHGYSMENRTSRPLQGEATQSLAKRPGTRNRKVLAIDSFYFEVGRRCTKYICDDCGRMMMSRFAFLRHLHDHEQPRVKSSDEEMEIRRPSKTRAPRNVPKYCNVCRRNVRDGARHRMYHTIVKLESEFPSSASMLAHSS